MQPILQAKCVNCHGTEEREGGLRLLGRRDILSRNDSGSVAVTPGKSTESELFRRVASSDETERMPPEGTPLNAEQIDLVKQWIDEGAVWPEGAKTTHWAYVPPQKAELPEVSDPQWIQNPIDAYVLARIDATPGLQKSPTAAPGKLLRRTYLDLIGLPPSAEEVKAFEANPTPEHFEEIVDRLLQSPRYGEKWARQWLDLARYADSNGFQADQFREIWPYRDWVINAMNNDMPFDQFTIEQIAGDLIPNATLQQKIATGFHRCTTCNVEAGVDPEENRVNQVIDRVNTTGMVWLGTSLECCQCHNHKYDPFTMQDYYQIFAYFNNTPLEVTGNGGVQFEVAGPNVELPRPADQQQQWDELNAQKESLTKQVDARKQGLVDELPAWLTSLREQSKNAPVWHTVSIDSATSTGGATFEPQDDGSLLVTGEKPEKDVYELEFVCEVGNISQLKLECLTDDRLPGKGPGRGDDARPNFVLYEFELASKSGENADWQPVSFQSAQADFSQNNWDVGGLIDGKPDTGWAINPEFSKPHWAEFRLAESIKEPGVRLHVRLPQHYGGARTIGRLRLSVMEGDPTASALPEEVAKLVKQDWSNLKKKERQQLEKYRQENDSQLKKLTDDLAAVEKKQAALSPPTSMVMVEMDETRETHILKRGNFLDPGDAVTPATPEALHQVTVTKEGPPNRLDFAEWLVDEQNPLMARVTVNRWWSEFFGQGIVATQEDFGSQGEPPTHQKVLDWLAVEFMENNWSMKHVHKAIVMSATYQQSSDIAAGAAEIDPYNKLLARGSRFRLSAESIRDNALAVSGLLSEKQGGPPVYPPQPANIWRHVGRNAPKYETDTDEDRFRRGIYTVWRRSAPYPTFVNFDAPDRGACVINRSRTNTPSQALTLLNDAAFVEMAQALTQVLLKSPAANDQERISEAFLRTVARAPTQYETEKLLALVAEEKARFTADAKLADQLVPSKWRLENVDLAEQAAWQDVAFVLLNLDETITRD
ncbi:MAG: PSD1 domain-containing protein [Planctomycetaceae bacterium]|nr:PSD1 domain-containing protein [Planctomycetaceae bacterium]